MTSPTGKCFISYRRTHLEEISRLVQALNAVGVPTWQDIKNLNNTSTETEIRIVLKDSNTSSAVLFITKDVSESEIIKKVEAKLIVERVAAKNGFFATPVVADKLSYKDAADLFDGSIGAHDLETWNLERLPDAVLDLSSAISLARSILEKRLRTIAKGKTSNDPLKIFFSTRKPVPESNEFDLCIDWNPFFSPDFSGKDTWETLLLPSLRNIADVIGIYMPNHPIEISGFLSLPIGIALGTVFLEQRGISITWLQSLPNGEKQKWGLAVNEGKSDFEERFIDRDIKGKDIAVLISVNDDVANGFSRTQVPNLRVVIEVKPKGGFRPGIVLNDPSKVKGLVQLVSQAIRTARTGYSADGAVHIFAAIPLGVAVLLGQKLNTLATVQTYDFVADASQPYTPAVLLNPSI